MTEKPPVWADLLLTLWVVVVALFYFGGYFLPSEIGAYTDRGAKVYALMALVSGGILAARFLGRKDEKRKDEEGQAREASDP